MLIVALTLILLGAIYTYFKWSRNFWNRANVPIFYRKNFSDIFTESIGDQMKYHYNDIKSKKEVHGGFYQLLQPIYMAVEPNLIKMILTKDFDHFIEKAFYINEEDQPLSAHLFTIGGDKWRTLRQKLSPTFTSGKMKMMFETVLKSGIPLLEALDKIAEGKTPLDIKEIAAKYTTDIIGSVAFGIECNSFKEENSDFRNHGRNLFLVTPFRFVKAIFQFSFLNLSKILRLVPFPTESEKFFNEAIKETIEYREKNKIVRNDFMHMLINLLRKGNVEGTDEKIGNKITFDELVAQAFVFFIAGFETSSTTMTFAMFELAQNQELQDKVRNEINEVLKKYDGKITYDALNELVFLKQVIDETLRKYPPFPTIDRKSTKPYKVPGTDAVIPPEVRVVISTLGLHRDPDYFPDPDKFDPERFSKENIGNIKEFTYMPFGEGPRLCIGMRFGFMQTKLGLITLLKDYRYTLNEKTSPKAEIGLGFILSMKGDVFLNVERIKN